MWEWLTTLGKQNTSCWWLAEDCHVHIQRKACGTVLGQRWAEIHCEKGQIFLIARTSKAAPWCEQCWVISGTRMEACFPLLPISTPYQLAGIKHPPLVSPWPGSHWSAYLQSESCSWFFRWDFSPVSLFRDDVWKTEVTLSCSKRGEINSTFSSVEHAEWYLGTIGIVIRITENLFSNNTSSDDNSSVNSSKIEVLEYFSLINMSFQF